MTRPLDTSMDIEQAEQTYRTLLKNIEAVLKDNAHLTQLEPPRTGRSGCGHGPRAERRSVSAVFRGSVPEAHWDRVERRLHEMLTGLGYTTRVVLVDKPSEHRVEWVKPDEASVAVGSAVATTVTVFGSCHPVPGKT